MANDLVPIIMSYLTFEPSTTKIYAHGNFKFYDQFLVLTIEFISKKKIYKVTFNYIKKKSIFVTEPHLAYIFLVGIKNSGIVLSHRNENILEVSSSIFDKHTFNGACDIMVDLHKYVENSLDIDF